MFLKTIQLNLRRGAALLRWNRASYVLMSGFLAIVLLIMWVWWPLVQQYWSAVDPRYPVWVQLDWLLLGIFAVMSILIMAGPDLRADTRIVLIGLAGGLVIESWGTQTNLWTYFTLERPPLWIIPAWPIASLAIDRLFRVLLRLFPAREPALGVPARRQARTFVRLYWLIFAVFYAMLLAFVWPTLNKSLTVGALLLCALLIMTPTDHRGAVLTFLAGAGLGYFLELWGTTRQCWIYYTHETPPLFAVLAHGMAAVAFWRTGLLSRQLQGRLLSIAKRWRAQPTQRTAEPAAMLDEG